MPASGIDFIRSSLAMRMTCHTQLAKAHALCDSDKGRARPKKVCRIIKLLIVTMLVRRGLRLRGQMLEIVFSGKIITFLSVVPPNFQIQLSL